MKKEFTKKIKMLIMDVDGTLTDGKIYYGNNGEELKAFDIKDGYGLNCCCDDLITVIITGRKSEIVSKRSCELNLNEVYQGISDKLTIAKEVCKKYNISLEEAAYIGDDLNDLIIMQSCGLCACPNDSYKKIKEIADYVCEKDGGRGAVREFIDFIHSLNGKL